MNDDEFYKIAAESFENVELKKKFNELHENLKRSFSNLRKWIKHFLFFLIVRYAKLILSCFVFFFNN